MKKLVPPIRRIGGIFLCDTVNCVYQKYHTQALVLRSYDHGEADRVFALYTEEFGFVWARASAVRRETSKMRYALQNYARAHTSLVRGNRGWRVAGASSLAHLTVTNKSGAATFARIASLVERLVRGEEQNDYLFTTLIEAHSALMKSERDTHGAIELLCVARVLYALGYVSTEALGTALFTHSAYELTHLTEAELARPQLLVSVNRALTETQL